MTATNEQLEARAETLAAALSDTQAALQKAVRLVGQLAEAVDELRQQRPGPEDSHRAFMARRAARRASAGGA